MKKVFYLLRNHMVPFLADLVISALSKSLKIYFINDEVVRKLKNENKKIVYVFWHGRQFLMVYAHRNKKISILTSLSKDGDLQTKILSKFGYRCVRGSSTRGGAEALRGLIRAMREDYDSAFAVDGPRGPVYKVKPGALFLAQITGAVVLPVACAVSGKKIFEKAWDKYELPFPFSKAVIIYGAPIILERGDSLEAKAEETEKALKALTEKAESFFLKEK